MKVPADEATPGWAFTIGLFHRFGHPELIVFGLPLDVAHEVLNLTGEAIGSGKVYEDGSRHDDFLEGYSVVVRSARPRWIGPFLGLGSWFYSQEAFPFAQLLWPDREGRMPWDPDASPWMRDNQPLLYEDTIEAARTAALLESMDVMPDA